MDPPPAPPFPAATTAAYPGSLFPAASSGRTRSVDRHHNPPPPAAAGEKLRLICSYNGHIVPRPHDKTLCYVGGDTRIFVADRRSSLPDIADRLSKTLINGQPFTLKYQLPDEDLDSLISVSTEEDLENMIEEYDRVTAGTKSGRIRLFLFQVRPDSASSLESFFDTSKSEDWFSIVLNGSDSGSVNSLHDVVSVGRSFPPKEEEKLEQLLETTPSCGSASSLPSVRVHAEERREVVVAGIEEKFSQMTVNKGSERGGDGSLAFPSTSGAAGGGAISGEYLNRIFSDDERSEQGVGSVGYGKGPMQSEWKPAGGGGGVDLMSPDSLSESGMTDQMMTAMMYTDHLVHSQTGNNKVAVCHDPFQAPQVKDSGYVLSTQIDQQSHRQSLLQRQKELVQQQQFVRFNSHEQQQQQQQQQQQRQQQFIQSGAQYIHHHPSGVVPVASCFPVYPPQQQPVLPQDLNDQNHPLFRVPTGQAQAYGFPIQQPNINKTNMAFSQSPPIQSHEIVKGVYRTATLPDPTQHQLPHVGFSHIRHSSQPIPPSSNYAYDISNPSLAQVYYADLAPQLAAQYPNVTLAPMAVFPGSWAPISNDNVNHQSKNSQP